MSIRTTLAACALVLIVTAGGVSGTIDVTAPAVQDDPPTSITECTVITDPGRYVLGNDIGPASGEEPCLLLESSDVTLDGNGYTIDGDIYVAESGQTESNRRITLRNVTADVLAGSWELRDVTVTSSDLADGVSAIYFTNLTVTDSRLGGPISAGDDTGDVVVTNSTFDGEQGVMLSESANGAFIANNTFETSHTAIRIGAVFDYTKNVRITNNRIDAGGAEGISTTEGGRDIEVRNNEITNASVAIDFLTPGVISNNTLSESDVGISVTYMELDEGDDELRIADNRINDNRVGVFVDSFFASPQNIRLRGNLIAGNSEFGVHNYYEAAYGEDFETPLLDARGNDWGDASGPSSAPADDSDAPFADPVTGRLADGSGDAVSEGNTPGVSNVRFDPLAGEPTTLPPLDDSYAGPPQDLDGDGVHEDVNGDGELTIVDVQAFFLHYEDAAVQNNVDAFDVNGDGVVNIVDVQALFIEQQGGQQS